MDALIGKPIYSNVTGASAVSTDLVGTGTIVNATTSTVGANTQPTGTTFTGARDNATAITPTTVYSGARDNATATTPAYIDAYQETKPIPTPTAPIIPIIVTPTPIISPMPLISGGFGGGGGASSSVQKVVAEKPNFIKKNILPILLVGSAIYVIIKKPI